MSEPHPLPPRRSLWLRGRGLVLLLSLAACGSSGDDPADRLSATERQAEIAVLMVGNSHTVGAGLPSRLAAVLRQALPGRSVAVVVAPRSGFLDEHLADPDTQALLAARRWSAVLLQAQKYSSSGLVDYPTREAETLVRRTRSLGAVPVLFPEWARRGIAETERIWALHSGIAGRAPACVAPVPQAWDEALAQDAALPLHAADGNHAAAAGAQLTALVLAATVTGLSPDAGTDLPGAGTPALQQQLREAATRAVQRQDPRAFCPGDALVR